MLTLLAALLTVEPSPVRECKILAADFVIIDEGVNTPPKPKDIWADIVAGCKRNYGPTSCPTIVEFKASNGHIHVSCEKP